MPEDTKSSVPDYVVAVKDAFVADDISRTILDCVPNAQLHCASPLETAGFLSDSGLRRVAIAFVEMGPDELQDSGLAAVLERLGARIVLFGAKAEQAGKAAGYRVLDRPFSYRVIQAHLQNGPRLG